MTELVWTRLHPMLALRAALVALGLLCFAAPVAAQEGGVHATISSDSIRKGEILTLQIEVVGDSPDVPEIVSDVRSLSDFSMLSSSTSSSTTIVNGQMTRSFGFIYRLRPRTAGTLEIPPIDISVGNRIVRTPRFEVEVSGGGGLGSSLPPVIVTPPAGGTTTTPTPNPPGGATTPPPGGTAQAAPRRVPRPGEPWFLQIEADDPEIWLGQPTTVTYRFLRSAEQLGHAEVYDVQEPDFKGFWPREDEHYVPSVSVDVAGREYYAETLRRYALVPIETGRLTVSPISAQVMSGGVSAFGMGNKEWVASPSAEIEVKPLPPGAPAGFDVANVATSVTFSATPRVTGGTGLQELRVGDSVTLSVELTAEGLIEQMRLVPPADDARLLMFGPKIESEEYETKSGTVYGTRKVSFDFAPAAEGTYQLPALRFVYFDFKKGEYAEEVRGPWPIQVRGHGPNADEVIAQLAARESVSAAALEASDPGATGATPMLREVVLTPVATTTTPIYARPWYLALMALAPLCWIGLVGVSRIRRQRADTALDRKARGALGRAHKALRKAAKSHAGDAPGFASALDTIARAYVSERFELRARAMTGEQLVSSLRRKGAGASSARALSQLLADAAAARYGGADGLDIDETLSRARQTLADLDASAASREQGDDFGSARQRRGRRGGDQARTP